jgi:hypothetical protein
MRSTIFRIIAIVAFCWAIFGLLSLLSELRFLVDALDWSISHVSISFKAILLEIGKRISEAVSGYREFVRMIARLLHLPYLPSWVYEVVAVITLSIGRGLWPGERADRKIAIPRGNMRLFSSWMLDSRSHPPVMSVKRIRGLLAIGLVAVGRTSVCLTARTIDIGVVAESL